MSEAGDRRTVATVLEMVETYYGLPAGSIREHNRAGPLIVPRQTVMYLTRVELGMRLERIAANLDRDHSTIVHGAAIVQRSKDLWYLREVIRGGATFQPKFPSVDYMGRLVARKSGIPTATLRGHRGTHKARNNLLHVADHFNMVYIACVYVRRKPNWAERVLERERPDPLFIKPLINQVRSYHGTQQKYWAVSGRRYCLIRSPQKWGSPLPVEE